MSTSDHYSRISRFSEKRMRFSESRSYWHDENGEMFCEGVSLERIARKTGTPVYVYSAAAVLGRYRELDRAFAGRERAICYALKANPNAALCRLLSREGAGADVVSGGELQRALAAGFPPGRILFSGVGKTEAELRLALRSEIAAINVDSRGELDLLSRLARGLRRLARIAVRLSASSPGPTPHLTGSAATGVPAPRPRRSSCPVAGPLSAGRAAT